MISAVFSNQRAGSGSGRAANPGPRSARPARPAPPRARSDGGPVVPPAEAPHGRLQQRRGRGSRAGLAGGAADGAAAGGGRAVSGGAGGSGTRPRSELADRNPAVFHGFCSTIVLNNPRRRNALSLPMLQSLRRDLLHDVKSRELRVIVIAGTAAGRAGRTRERGAETRTALGKEKRRTGPGGAACSPHAALGSRPACARQTSLTRSPCTLSPASPFLYSVTHS